LRSLGELRGYLQFGFFVLPSHFREQIVPVRRARFLAELGELRGYLQFGFFVLLSHFRGQMSPVRRAASWRSSASCAVPAVRLLRLAFALPRADRLRESWHVPFRTYPACGPDGQTGQMPGILGYTDLGPVTRDLSPCRVPGVRSLTDRRAAGQRQPSVDVELVAVRVFHRDCVVVEAFWVSSHPRAGSASTPRRRPKRRASGSGSAQSDHQLEAHGIGLSLALAMFRRSMNGASDTDPPTLPRA